MRRHKIGWHTEYVRDWLVKSMSEKGEDLAGENRSVADLFVVKSLVREVVHRLFDGAFVLAEAFPPSIEVRERDQGSVGRELIAAQPASQVR